MTAEELVEEIRPILEELVFRRKQNPGHRHDDFARAIYPMLVDKISDEPSEESIKWIGALATAIFLINPQMNPDDVSDLIKEAACVADKDSIPYLHGKRKGDVN
jgi:hypothetical protein